MMAACGGSSKQDYLKLFELAGLRDPDTFQRINFRKTGGIDPYFIAELGASDVSPSSVFRTPQEWKKLDFVAVTPPEQLRWWQLANIEGPVIWTKKIRNDPSFSQVITGKKDGRYVIYAIWVDTFNY
jgi:hypothetical protein